MLAAAERGTQLSRQLLLFGRTETAERAVIDAVIVVEECVHTLKRLLPSEITLEMDLSREALPVRMLPSELQQIVLNLGINARDAMTNHGGGVLTLLLDRQAVEAADAQRLGIPEGEYAVITCRDTGTG